MKRPSALPMLVQVGALAAATVIASQAVAFGVILLSPPPRPSGFTVAEAAKALRGEPAETSDGRSLERRITKAQAVAQDPDDPMATVIRMLLARQLQVAPDQVSVRPERLRRPRGEPALSPPSSVVIRRSPDEDGGPLLIPRGSRIQTEIASVGTFVSVLPDPPERPAVRLRGAEVLTMSPLADRLSFGPFTASYRLSDGSWATVEPPRSLLSPWQKRMLLALGISALLLAPLVWWMARRLTRPIRAFAEAAERLGADPEAEPLKPTGPAEVRTAIHAFNDMQAAIRAHMRQRTQTVAAIAHDLRTPLTRLRFRAEQAPDTVRDRMAGDIEEMDALIGQAMAFVRGEATADRTERFDLSLLVEDCALGFAETGASVARGPSERMAVDGDPAALRRAVSNLIDNALKFAGSASVSAFREGDWAVVEVTDDGPGVDEDELEAVFEPFHRGERSRNRETGGAGLGLAVARQAARAAGGDVHLINRPEGGLIARLTAPVAG